MPCRLRVLHLSQIPASPPRFGAQARIHGLLGPIAARHDVTAVALLDEEFDRVSCERAMGAYCERVILIDNPRGRDGRYKRLLQLRSLASQHSFEHLRYHVPELQKALDELFATERFDLVQVEFPYLADYRFGNARRPPLVIDAHDIEFDLQRQLAGSDLGTSRRLYGALNWRKLRREELAAFRTADGVCVCSVDDQRRLLQEVPGARSVVVPNAADVEHYRPSESYPSPDGRTVLFFGLLSTFPNQDGVLHLLRDIWPRIAAARPHARLEILGARPSPAMLQHAGPRVSIPGFVEDLRPRLAAAAAVVVPLRLGGGTRLKIVEAMAMARPVVSTRLGAEGIDARHDQEILLADEPEAFASEVVRLLDDPTLGEQLGRGARRLAVERYSWESAAHRLDSFYGEVIGTSRRNESAA